MLEMGPYEQGILKQCYRLGQPIPDRIKNAPELIDGLNLYINAFFDLDSDRSHGFSVGRISWTAIKEYALAFEFDAIQVEDLFYFIRAMDTEYMKWMKAQTETK